MHQCYFIRVAVHGCALLCIAVQCTADSTLQTSNQARKTVDDLWSKVAKATVEGKLGSAAKVGPHDPNGL